MGKNKCIEPKSINVLDVVINNQIVQMQQRISNMKCYIGRVKYDAKGQDASFVFVFFSSKALSAIAKHVSRDALSTDTER